MKDKMREMRRRVAFGKYISDKRQRLGYSQTDVAEMIGVSRTLYLRYENGQRDVDLDTILQLSKTLRISVDDFIIKYDDAAD